MLHSLTDPRYKCQVAAVMMAQITQFLLAKSFSTKLLSISNPSTLSSATNLILTITLLKTLLLNKRKKVSCHNASGPTTKLVKVTRQLKNKFATSKIYLPTQKDNESSGK